MKHIHKLGDLSAFGFVLLTGEADRMCYRILCDVTAQGRDIFCEAYGVPSEHFVYSRLTKARDLIRKALGDRIPTDILNALDVPNFQGLAEPWNSGSDDDPHVGSVMLGYDSYLQIAPIALHKAGCHTILNTRHEDNGQVSFFGFEGHERFYPQEGDWNDETLEYENIRGPWYRMGSDNADKCRWPSCYGQVQRTYSLLTSQPGVGTRATHAMSGRTE